MVRITAVGWAVGSRTVEVANLRTRTGWAEATAAPTEWGGGERGCWSGDAGGGQEAYGRCLGQWARRRVLCHLRRR